MIKNYLKIAWRNLIAQKFNSLLNIGGLAIGFAAATLLLHWAQDERSFDKFHRDHDSIYRLNSRFMVNGEQNTWEGVPAPLSVLAKDIPEIEQMVRTSPDVDQNLSNEDRSKVMDGHSTAFVDSSFFSVFDFQLLEGNPQRPFTDIQSTVITRSTAEKFFGASDALGKTLRFHGTLFTISGILEDFPQNSSLQYDALFPMSFKARQFTQNGGNGTWKTIDTDLGNFNYVTYAKLRPGANAEKTGKGLSQLYTDIRKGEVSVDFSFQKLSDLHLVSISGDDSAKKMVDIFFLTAFLILIIAAVNYINMSTARIASRFKEISVRKLTGANKKQLFWQFTTEPLLIFLCAIVLAIVFIVGAKPLYEQITEKALLLVQQDLAIVRLLALASLGTFIASTIYPALLLASLNPITALKGKISKSISQTSIRKVLSSAQFAISTSLIVATIVIGKQLSFIQTQYLGYDQEHVFNVPLTWEMAEHGDAIKEELRKSPGISHAAISNIYDFSDLKDATGDIEWPGKSANNHFMIGQTVIDQDFIPTMQIQFLEGENFSGTPADSNRYILNETAVKEMGLKPPYSGQQISFHDSPGTIQGVVKDFHFKSLKEKISPLLMMRKWRGNILYVRAQASATSEALVATERVYKKHGEGVPFSYHFLSDQFDAKYKTDQQASALFNVFATLAIFISCLGLLGLSTYSMQKRVKEIAVRKVLGAGIPALVQLLSREAMLLVILGVLVASPIAWWFLDTWLHNFAYHIEIQWWFFALAALISLLIAFVTLSFQTVKAALANPVDSLRNE